MSAELPVAVIGIGCKLPGGSDTKDLYYDFLRNKGDGMTKPPSDRWDHEEWGGRPNEPGKYNSAMGGFIDGIDQFDPLEFGISMKEAQNMDPSSRLILEVAHQALIDSGLDYKGSRTGVYVSQLLFSASEMGDTNRYENNSYSSLGKCISLRANRVSFIFDLCGPSLTIDTACSSSATAMHLALSAIKLGEMDQAIIIGGSIMAHPLHNVMMSDVGVLSPTGSCKSFDAEADGYARAEGFAATVIKRLDKATEDKDHIYSIITGSSINANGRGIILTAPEADMQEEVIRQAYSLANRGLSDSFFVELHVTGTPTGDPIEVNAVGKIFSAGRKRDHLLRVGSVKANIGHTEGCSFLASLIKVSLMLKHKEIIPNIRYNKPNPKIDKTNWKFMKVQTQLEPITSNLAAPDGRWVTSISSYGIGGANAHVVIESLESVTCSKVLTEEISASSGSPPLRLFFIAAHTESAMLRWRASLATFYKDITDDRILRSLSYDLARQSRSCAVRSFTVGPTISSDNSFSETVVISPKVDPKLCLVFSGQGPQHIAMGRELCASYPVFLATIKQSDEILVRKFGKESFLERTGLFAPDKQTKLSAYSAWPVEDVVYSIVFIQLALVDLIKSLGIEFSYVVGHSIGEIAMGYASGLYDKETTIGITIARAAAMKKAEGNGSMVALGICFQRARYMIKQVLKTADRADGLWIAAINSPDAVTVAGREELVDILTSFIKDRGFFAAKLNVTCAFHTPLMEPQEEEFKTNIKAMLGNFQTRPPAAGVRIMSTVDGQWLERDMDINYFWDNIRRPVLFGTAINKVIKENSSENILFLEIAPHPVLKAYILQCQGQPISLIRRPNPKVPAQNTGEHYQFLEGVGNLLTSGFKAVDLARICSTPDGQQNFLRSHIPDYPYKKITCSAESDGNLSVRMRPKPLPLSCAIFRLSLGTHPDLAGHLIFDIPLFPLSGFLDSILEHGAMVIQDTVVLRPLVLNALGAIPAHVGCIINDKQWEFRSAITNTFYNGDVELDGIHARGSFSRHNPQLNHSAYPRLDLKAKLAVSRKWISGEEFYKAIPSAYGYRDCFSTCIQKVHEVPDENSWGGLGYLVEQEIPTDTNDSRDKGYVIHPSILDSIMHSALAMFIDMESKSFEFNGVILPSKVDSLARWDEGNISNLESQLHGTFWTYFTSHTWAPEGPFKCDYIVANSEGQVLLTIEGVEFTLAGVEPAPITDKREQCLTTVWQPKVFPLADDYHPSPALSLDRPSYLCKIFEELITKVQTAGRYVIRTLDLDTSAASAKALDPCLIFSLSGGLLVEYFCAGSSVDDADENVKTMQHPHARPIVLDLKGESLDEYDHSFDIVLQTIDLSNLPPDVGVFLQYLVPGGVLLLIAGGKLVETSEAESTQEQQNLAAFVEQLEAVPHLKISVTNLNSAEAIILIRSSPTLPETTEDPANKLVIHHFTHGNEEQLVKIITGLSEDSEIWIVGDDDEIGIGALGIAACVIAESPDFVVRSLLFENPGLGTKGRDDIVRSLRRNSSLLEQHMKYTTTGDVFVRRLVYGSGHVKDSPDLSDKAESDVSTLVQSRILGPTEMQLSVDFLATDNTLGERSYVGFLGTIAELGADIKGFSTETRVLGISEHPITGIVVMDQSSVVPIPDNVANRDAVTLSIASLAPWLGLVESSKISDSSTVLLIGADSHHGFIAVQICQRFGAKFLCTVSTLTDAKRLSRELRVDESSVITSAPGDDISLAIQAWLTSNKLDGFDVAFNLQGTALHGTEINFMTATGHYIHHQTASSAPTNIPIGAPITQVINISTLVERYPTRVTTTLANILAAHTAERFRLPSHCQSFSKLSDSTYLSVSKGGSLAIAPNVPSSIHVIESGQLFDPAKSYLLLGGSSELGVRIAVWMVSRGARKFVLTSRRGPTALNKVDSQYLYYLRSSGVSVKVLAADAGIEREMKKVMIRANEMGPVGGIFLMTVVSRDGLFATMDQRSFDDVYLSKVQSLDTVLTCIDPATLDFLLLFSTIGSVFGNAGQAAYCASQLYLDRMAEILPNTISISLPPITDSGMFKRLVMSSKGRSSTNLASKIGMTTVQVCSFIADSLVRRIQHYVPMIPIKAVPEVFSTCEPLLYHHLLPTYFLNVAAASNQGGTVETPLSLLCELLGLDPEQIAKNIPLRDYGLDSLGAIRYSRELKGHFGLKISQIELLGSVTIDYLENKLQDVVTSAGDDSDPDEKFNADIQGLVPLETERMAYGDTYTTDAAPFQSRIGAQISSTALDIKNSRDYSSGYLVSITSSALDIDRVRNAFNELVQRHGILRTTFSWSTEGKLKQTVHSFMDFDITVLDFSNEANPARELALVASKKPDFKIDKLPLFTVTIVNLGHNKWNLSLVFHDIIMDDASFGIVLNEFFVLYHNGFDSLSPQLVQFSDFSDWFFNDRRIGSREGQQKVSTENIKDIQPLNLGIPNAHNTPLSDIAQVEAKIDPTVISQYLAFVDQSESTASDGFFAAFSVLLYRLSLQTSFVMGTPVSQRRISRLANVVGPITNILPITTTILEDQSFHDYFSAFKSNLLASFANDDEVYYDGLHDPSSDFSPRSHLRHVFAHDRLNLDAITTLTTNTTEKLLHLDDICSLMNIEKPYELLLDVYSKTGHVILHFDNYLFSAETARKILDAYITIVGRVALDSQVKISDIAVEY